MKHSLFALPIAGVAALQDRETSYARLMTDSMIRFGVEPDWHYDQATLYTSLEAMYEFTSNETIYDYYRSHVDPLVLDNGDIVNYNFTRYSLDNYRFGNNVLWFYKQTGEEKFKLAADKILAALLSHPRNPSGGFWHRIGSYPNQMWLDGIYMADSFYAKYVSEFQPNNQTAWDDIVLQYDLIDGRTRKENNLLVHGYDESKRAVWADPVTGAAPLVWGRAVGWYFMSLLETLAVLPKEHEGYERLMGYYVNLAKGLKDAQDEKGAWWNVMEERYEDIEGNYLESSASVMFTFGWLRGLNLGLLPEEDYADVAKKAYNAMIDLFVTSNDNGTINWEDTVEVGSLGSNATFEYYASIALRQNDLRGAGCFMIAAKEWETRIF